MVHKWAITCQHLKRHLRCTLAGPSPDLSDQNQRKLLQTTSQTQNATLLVLSFYNFKFKNIVETALADRTLLHVKERTSKEKSRSCHPFLQPASSHQPVYQAQALRFALSSTQKPQEPWLRRAADHT